MWRSLCGLGLLILRNANRKSEMERYLFLDFDGVLNTEHYQNLLYYEGKALQDEYGWTMSAWHCSSWEWQTKWEKMPKKKEKGKIQERTVFRHLQTTKKVKRTCNCNPIPHRAVCSQNPFSKVTAGRKGWHLGHVGPIRRRHRRRCLSLTARPIIAPWLFPYLERLFPSVGKIIPTNGKKFSPAWEKQQSLR